MKRILVTGAAGQLGAELCRLLGQSAVPIDIDKLDLTAARRSARPWPKSSRSWSSIVPPIPRWTRPKASRGCAGPSMPSPSNTWSRPAAGWIARWCRSAPITSSAPAADPPRPHREDDPTSPQGVYAQTKLEGEWAAAKHPKHLIVRTCGLYARPSHQEARNFVKTILRFARSSDKLRVVADQHCTPSYVPHVARACSIWPASIARPRALGHLSRHQSRRRPPGTSWPARSCGWPASRSRSRPSPRPNIRVPPPGPPIACWTQRPIIVWAGPSCPIGKRPSPNISRTKRAINTTALNTPQRHGVHGVQKQRYQWVAANPVPLALYDDEGLRMIFRQNRAAMPCSALSCLLSVFSVSPWSTSVGLAS